METEQAAFYIMDNSPVGCCVAEVVLDNEGKPADWIYRYCNQAFADRKNYRLDAIVNHSFLSLFTEMDERWLKAYYQAAYENKTGRMTLPEKESCHAVLMPTGRKGFCVCILQENLDEAEDPSQTENENYILHRLMPEYVSLYRVELISGKYEILRLNSKTNAGRMVNEHPQVFDTYDAFVQYYADSFILPEDRQEFTEQLSCRNMKERLEREEKFTYHYHSVSKEGMHSYYEAYAVPAQQTEEGEFHIFIGYRNIDSILYKEKEIQARLQKALEEARLGNEIISAIAKTYQYISRIDIQADTFEEITNRDKKNLNFTQTGILSVNNKKVCREFVDEKYQDAFFQFTDLTTLPMRMAQEESIVMEYRMKDGNWHRMRFIEKKRDENGNLTHVLCVIRSISDTKKREQNLVYEVEEAKKDAALKTRFLSNMSHDIRTPMNGIMGMLELAERYPEDLAVQEKCRKRIMESSQYLVSIVNDILDISKLEDSNAKPQDVLFDLTELLNRTNTEKQKQAENKNVEYIVDWNRAEIKHMYLIGNPVYLSRLLHIVSDNAVKFTRPGGSIHVWCAEQEVKGDRVTYEFGCADNGIGMSEEFLPHAFEMFSQEKETSRANYEGTGLGLAIAKKLVERMDGSIELKSRQGVGTIVRMRLTFGVGEAIEMTPSTPLEEIPVKGCRVLVAEDNELNMEIARFMLEDRGIIVESALDGVEAVQKFEASVPGYYDAIFMDIMMPNMSGWDAARKIRSMKRKDSGIVPIIAMSANAFADDIINSRISGMNQHLTKPLDEDKMLAALKDGLMEAARSQRKVQ